LLPILIINLAITITMPQPECLEISSTRC
jgi:hypothetical protein